MFFLKNSKLKIFLFLSLLICIPAFGNPNPKYQRVMIFNGLGFAPMFFLGLYHEAIAQNKKPDLLIATCGGAITGSVINYTNDLEKQKEIILSQDFYDSFSNSIKPGEDSNIFKTILLIGRIIINLPFSKPELVNVYERNLIHVEDTLDYLPQRSFPFQKQTIPLLIVAGRVNFNKKEVGLNVDEWVNKNKMKPFSEVYISDEETLKTIQNLQVYSFISKLYPESNVDTEILFRNNIPIVTAMRASTSDAYLYNPTYFKDEYYLGGQINLYPIELAQILSEEVFVMHSRPFAPPIETNAIKKVYNYDPNLRLKYTDSLIRESDYWIDASDFSSELAQEEVSSWKVRVKMLSYEDYVSTSLKHYSQGKERFLEALKNKGSLTHVRNLQK